MTSPTEVNILLVDDRPENLLALEAILEGPGHRLVKASSGTEALQRLLDRDFALILLDLQMPTMDGIETARLIRQRDRSRATPIVLLTAHDTTEADIRDAYEAGAVDFLSKPVMPEVLKAKVSTFVALARNAARLHEEIEKRSAAEAEARALAEDLELRVEERTTALQEAYERVEDSVRKHQSGEERLGLLADAAETLLGSLDAHEVVPRILELSQRLFAADAYAMWRLFPEKAEWRVIADVNLPASYSRVTPANNEPIPPTPFYVDDIRCDPLLASRVQTYRAENIRSLLCLPLLIHGVASGTIVFYFREPRHIAEIDLRLGSALGNLAATALTTAELYQQQTHLRSAAEGARERLAFLADASRLLVSSLDYEVTLQRIAALAVPKLADWCAVYATDPGGGIRPVAVAHANPDKVALAQRLHDRYPVDPDAPFGIARVIRTGETQLTPRVTDGLLERGARDAEHLRMIRELALHSALIVPLRSARGTVGAIALHWAESRREFNSEDVLLAEDLAGRAAAALENARLYREARAAAEAYSRSERRFRHLVENGWEAIALFGRDRTATYVSPSITRLLGYGPEEYLGGMGLAHHHPDDAAMLAETFEHVRSAPGNVVHVRFRNQHADGSWRWLEGTATNLLDDPDVGAIVANIRDVTDSQRAEEALRSREESLRIALQSAHLGTWDRNILTGEMECSALCKKAFGRTPEEPLPHEEVLAAVHPDDRETMRAAVARAIEDRTDYEAEYRIVWSDGSVHWIHAHGRAFYDEAGRPIRMIGVIRDTTERKELAEALRSSEEQFRTLVEQSPLSIQILSPDGRTLQVNRAWEELWGAKLEDLQGYNMLEDQQLEELGILPYIRFGFTLGATSIPPVMYDRRRTLPGVVGDENTERWVSAQIYPVRDSAGEIRKVVLVHEDFTARKHLEDELRKRVEELDEASYHKDQFLAMLAHELRNPLGAVSNALYVMERAAADSPSYQRARDIALRQVHHQTRLVDDLLDVSRITRGKIHLQRDSVSLTRVVRDAVEDRRIAFERGGLVLEVDLPTADLLITGDATRISQVVSNLLDNALKFTAAGGRVSVALANEDADRACLSVTDTGIGIAPELLPYIFEPFRQADTSLDRTRGGLGLGLALVRGIVELHGGEVRVHSEGPGRGASLSVTLPLSHAPEVIRRSRDSDVRGNGERRKVLVVEDNADAAETLRDLLEMQGYSVQIALDGIRGIAAAGEFEPNVILCDIGLPGMDGFRVAEQLRRDPANAGTRLVALTGYGGLDDRERAREAGFDDYLVKPVDPARLHQVLASS